MRKGQHYWRIAVEGNESIASTKQKSTFVDPFDHAIRVIHSDLNAWTGLTDLAMEGHKWVSLNSCTRWASSQANLGGFAGNPASLVPQEVIGGEHANQTNCNTMKTLTCVQQ